MAGYAAKLMPRVRLWKPNFQCEYVTRDDVMCRPRCPIKMQSCRKCVALVRGMQQAYDKFSNSTILMPYMSAGSSNIVAAAGLLLYTGTESNKKFSRALSEVKIAYF